MTEIELKLEVAAADAGKLLGDKLFAVAQSSELTSIYFDTSTRQLRDAGFSLRVRHAGDRRIQTIKADGLAAAGLFVRAEWERDIDGDTPVVDGPEQPLAQHVGGKALARIAPAFRTQISRAVAVTDRADAVIELVLDQGEIVAADRSAAVCELELELRSGARSSLFELARRLDEVAAVRLGVLSKSERGYRLADGSDARAVKSEPVALTADMTASTAFQAIAAACIRQFRLNEMLLAESSHAGALHQARVALRRLRSALSLFRPMLAGDTFDHLRGELRWIAGTLGEARNIDVLAARFADALVLARLEQGRQHAYVDVGKALASPRLRHLMLGLAEWLAVGEWLAADAGAAARDEPVLAAAANMLDRYRKRVRRRGAGLLGLDDESRHALRIEAKKLRYASEFFASLYTGKKGQRRSKLFRGALDELQEQLGQLNDLATMPSVLVKLGIADELVPDTIISRAERDAVLHKAERAYAALIDARCFWR